MKELFAKIADVQPKLKGWCTPEKAITLASIVLAKQPLVSLEIGVYGGSSFIPIALAHKAIGRGIAIGVDPWDKSAAILAQTEEASRQWWSAQDLEAVYREVVSTIQTLELGQHAKLMRQKSSRIDVPPSIGLLHIDGAHNDEAINDVVRFCHHVDIGGFVVMDDLNWQGGGPARAAQRLVQMGYNHLYPVGQTGAVFQRIR